MCGSAFSEKYHRVSPRDQRNALADREVQLNRADLASILFAMQSRVQWVIVVEFPIGLGAGAVEDIDEVPGQIVQIGLDARVLQASRQRIEYVGDRTGC